VSRGGLDAVLCGDPAESLTIAEAAQTRDCEQALRAQTADCWWVKKGR
jgi:hypothetical protein